MLKAEEAVMTPKGDIRLGPNDLVIPDIDKDLIERLRLKGRLSGRSFEDIILDTLALGADIPRERLNGASVIWLDDET